MDEQDVWDCVGVAVLALLLAVVVWLLVSPRSGGSGGGDLAGVSHRQDSRSVTPSVPAQTPVSAHRRLLDQVHRCIDATAARGLSGCTLAFEPSAPPPSSEHRAHRSTRSVAVRVTSPPTQVAAPSAPV